MNLNNNKNYHLVSNISEIDLDDNNSLKKMLRLIGDNKRVLDFGCSVGYFAQVLANRGCQVIGIEANQNAAKVAEQHCEQVIVADLDFVSLSDILRGQAFDVAVFGDVLEHLRDPWKVLKETQQLLKPEGSVVASIPNIAHGAIRLSLLKGRFEYMAQGILDNTHLRFFTRKTVEELFDRSGYFIDVMERTKIPVTSISDLIPHIEKETFDIKILQEIEQDEDVDTLQFIVRAFPLSLEGKYISLEGKYLALESQYADVNKKYSMLVDEAKSSDTQLHQLRSELEQLNIQLQDKKTELENLQSEFQQKQATSEFLQIELQQTKAELEGSQLFLQQTKAELEGSQLFLQQTKAELEGSQLFLQQTKADLQHSQVQQQQLQSQLQEAHAGWRNCQNIIQAMESSKFWRLRQLWLGLKHSKR